MKRILYNIFLGCTVALLFSACVREMDSALECEADKGSGNIILDISSSAGTLSRAGEVSEGVENAISYIDVMICSPESEDNEAFNDATCIHYERIPLSPNADGRSGIITLNKKRDDFQGKGEFWVYAIANLSVKDNNMNTIDEEEVNRRVLNKKVSEGIRTLIQVDSLIHFTGLDVDIAHQYSELNPPQRFLMDGIAYADQGSESTVIPDPAPVLLHNGTASDNTKLKVLLKRAAAKIEVTIKRKTDTADGKVYIEKFVTSHEDMNEGYAHYYFNKLPSTVRVMSGAELESPALRISKPSPPISGFSTWGADEIKITTYAYPYDWAGKPLNQQVHLVVNLPMLYDDDGVGVGEATTVLKQNNYYQIPISKNQILKRNNYYKLEVNVNVLGSESTLKPVTLENIQYDVYDWSRRIVEVGGETDQPAYLFVNEDTLEMYTVKAGTTTAHDPSEEDNTTLTFNSSVTLPNGAFTIKSAYYYNKTGVKTDVSEDIKDQIKVTATGVKGNISVYSPMPTNNAIRYIDIEINNGKATRTFTVKQYPLEYITSILGYYSYRDDFGGTDYEHLNGVYVKPGDSYSNSNQSQISNRYCGTSWSSNSSKWSHGNTTTSFFGSKVRGDTIASGKQEGLARIYYYSWKEGYYNRKYSYNVERGSDVWNEVKNPRMYHVRITASSSEYTLGNPRLSPATVAGEILQITDPNPDNSLLVSPSFMIASQLGAVMSASNVNVAASHCAHYVETYQKRAKNPDGSLKVDEKGQPVFETIHLDDWRLPTKSEIEIIIKFQYAVNAAMDEVLAGPSYWSASGIVENSKGDGSENAIRCIRDAYTE